MQKTLLWTLALLAVTLAGCSDDGSGKSDDDDTFDGIDTEATATTGVIRGVVVDETFNPIIGADIKILNSELATTSSETGAFAFSKLDPNTYFFTVSAVGFKTQQSSVEVVAGIEKPEIKKVMLIRDVGTLPEVVHLDFAGYIGCSFQVGVFVERNVCGIGPGPDPDNSPPFNFGTEAQPDVIQTELVWEHTQEIGRRLTTIQCIESTSHESCAASGSSKARFGSIHGESPLICRSNATYGCENEDGTGGGAGINATAWTGQVQLAVYANCYETCLDLTPVGLWPTVLGAGLVLQQDYHMYSAIFYNIDPDPEWTFFEDGEYKIPDVET